MGVVDIRRSWNDLGIKDLNLPNTQLAAGPRGVAKYKLTKL